VGGAFTNEDLERRRGSVAPPSLAPASPRPIGWPRCRPWASRPW